jgi:hypothetical protein
LSAVYPKLARGGHVNVQTAATGSNWTAFAAQPATQLTITNDTGVSIEFSVVSAGVTTVTVFNGTYFTFYGLANLLDIQFRRVDQSNTQVIVKARWEGMP